MPSPPETGTAVPPGGRRDKECEMPKLKSKSSAKKRFKFTAKGHIKVQQAGKRHGMIKRSNKQIRNLRGTDTVEPCDEKRIRRMLPYGSTR